jgi:hypothetical protein
MREKRWRRFAAVGAAAVLSLGGIACSDATESGAEEQNEEVGNPPGEDVPLGETATPEEEEE